jgi:hypothetical protein
MKQKPGWRSRRSWGRLRRRLGDLLDFQLEVVDDGFDFGTPGTQIRRRRFQQRHTVRGFGEHVVNADGFEGGEAQMDVVVLPVEECFKVGEARADVRLSELVAGRRDDGGRRFESADALVDLCGPRGVSPLEVGETRLPLLVLSIEPAIELIEHEFEVWIHGTAGTLEACEVRVGQIGIQDRESDTK